METEENGGGNGAAGGPGPRVDEVERAIAAQRAAEAAAAAVAAERAAELARAKQLPRAVIAIRKPAAAEGWKDTRAVAEATERALRHDAGHIYSQIYPLRPQGRDWLTYSAVRMRAVEGRGVG